MEIGYGVFQPFTAVNSQYTESECCSQNPSTGPARNVGTGSSLNPLLTKWSLAVYTMCKVVALPIFFRTEEKTIVTLGNQYLKCVIYIRDPKESPIAA